MFPKSIFAVSALLLLGSTQAQIPADVELVPAFGGQGFNFPIAVRHAGDGLDRKFVVEKAGRIRVVDASGTLLGTNFLDISGITESSASERGLLGLAFHPDFSSNGLVYIKHSAQSLAGVTTGDTVVAEYTVSSTDSNQLDPASRRQILVIPQDFNNHNGGDLHFGPDGYLYIGMGDGGSGNDPCNRGQVLDPSTSPGSCRSEQAAWLLGKMIRIDIDNTTAAGSNNLCAAGGDGSAEYAVPADNPFAGMSNRCGEVWSYGQRNPYRFSFDRETGDLWVGDVGQSTWEEINFEPASNSGGDNYGWRVCEGNWQRGSTTTPCSLSDQTGPVIEYRTGVASACAVTGGFRYRGPVVSMNGSYIYGDYCSGRIWFANETSPGQWTPTEFGLLGGFGNLVGFGEDETGNLYVVRGSGQILRFIGDTGPGDPIFGDRFEQEGR